MKKTAVSSFIIVSFIFYALFKNRSTAAILPEAASGESNVSRSSAGKNSFRFKDGVYTGISADAYYGYIQVKAIINNGQLTDVNFLQYPSSHGRSIVINTLAMPILKQEAITAQSAKVDGVTGATDTSQAFIESLTSALTKARV